VLGQVLAEFKDRARLVYKDFPLPFHAGARPAAEAARCAGDQGQFWPYHDLLFLAQPAFSRDDLAGYAERLKLDRGAFVACLDGGTHRDAVSADLAEGRALGVTGTPTFFVNGRKLVGAQPLEVFREAIEQALADAARPR
jgi:protein-disulfide isomerase